jgi:hypothetical protein
MDKSLRTLAKKSTPITTEVLGTARFVEDYSFREFGSEVFFGDF